MVTSEPAELLAVWESGLPRTPGGHALLLHRAARPGVSDDELRALPVGERAADLLMLRRELFGERMQVLVACASCGDDMEFDLDVARLAERPAEHQLQIDADGYLVEFRLPTVADLEAAAAGSSAEERRLRLLSRCTVAAEHHGEPVGCEVLPESVQRRMAEAAERADPAADLALSVSCPECGCTTPSALDIASYLWAELDSWARDVLLDVHLLASAYGWTEPSILSLSPLRRRYYLELCADG
ncbi:hypothetical protein E1161_21085 [Saccharopolyspora aridisoli]|uniref:Phage baseplate protein n=1 Tax=Saccharopolyspora aridisoli TaxID=2530385 RepID=A0A4R4UKX2_9PSEU|nr:hypothetical protein [Saccharopolyspora aridisoli]TDC89522.1 hypothetical protein E1161_21085 [Saccharopolyspora aridisoli]